MSDLAILVPVIITILGLIVGVWYARWVASSALAAARRAVAEAMAEQPPLPFEEGAQAPAPPTPEQKRLEEKFFPTNP